MIPLPPIYGFSSNTGLPRPQVRQVGSVACQKIGPTSAPGNVLRHGSPLKVSSPSHKILSGDARRLHDSLRTEHLHENKKHRAKVRQRAAHRALRLRVPCGQDFYSTERKVSSRKDRPFHREIHTRKKGGAFPAPWQWYEDTHENRVRDQRGAPDKKRSRRPRCRNFPRDGSGKNELPVRHWTEN